MNQEEGPGPWAWVGDYDPDHKKFWDSQWDPRTIHSESAEEEGSYESEEDGERGGCCPLFGMVGLGTLVLGLHLVLRWIKGKSR